MADFGFVGPTYTLDAMSVAAQRTVNLYPQAHPEQKNKLVLRAIPGLHQWVTGLNGDVRCLWSGGSLLFAVAGSKLYSIDSGATATELGEVGDDSNPAQIIPTQDGAMVVSADKAYWWGGVTVDVIQIDAADMEANAGAFLDGYFIAIDRSVDPLRLRHSALFDAETWDALDYASKEAHADALHQLLVSRQDLHLFGTETIETWRNNYSTAPESFPWERDPGAIMQMGLKAIWTPTQLSRGIAWVGGDQRGSPVAWIADGYTPRRISTPAVEEAWQAYSSIADAVAYTYTDGGHEFYVINFYTGDATWVYDVTTNMWHERGDGTALGVHRGRVHTYQFGKHLVGDYENGTIWEMSRAFGDDNGADIRRLRTSPYIHDGAESRVFHHRLQVDLQADSSLDVDLEWSNDSGRNWSPVVSATTGPGDSDGETRALWRKLGEARHRIYRAQIDSQVADIALISADLKLTPGKA